MKQFLIKIALYTAIIVVLLMALHLAVVSGLRKSEFGNLKEWREILGGQATAKLLIQGSSRAWVHYDTRLIDSLMHTSSYNSGMDGAPFDIQYIRWKAYLANHQAPEVIFQNVDLDLLDGNEEVFQKYQYLAFLNNKAFQQLLVEHRILDLSDRLFPFTSFMGQPQAIKIGIEAFLGITTHPSSKYKGFAAHRLSWDGTNLEILRTHPPREWVADARLKDLFVRFIHECKAHNIRLVLVYAPVHTILEDVVVDFQGSRDLYRQLAEEYQLEYYDYSLCDLSGDQSNFYNATHLNAQGASAFTRKLVEDMSRKRSIDAVKH